MPKTETPKTPEQNEKPQKPSPETREKRNTKAENDLKTARKKSLEKTDKARKKYEESLRDGFKEEKEINKPVIDEGNRGEEAWHKAHKERNTPKPGETNTEGKKREKDASKKIDELRKGKINGEDRKYSPTTLINTSTDIDHADDFLTRRKKYL